MEKILAIIGAGVFTVMIIVLVSFLLALPVMLLWNWLIPLILQLPELTLFQAWGLTVLCGFLFRSSSKSSV